MSLLQKISKGLAQTLVPINVYVTLYAIATHNVVAALLNLAMAVYFFWRGHIYEFEEDQNRFNNPGI